MSNENTPYLFWNTKAEQKEAFEKAGDNINCYDGIRSSSASRRSYLDIEPNISVRPSFTRDDYYRFRDVEAPGATYKASIQQCMKAYEKVGIIRNVIDLMGDFASQGITLNHPNKSVERFYRKWWARVSGTERSERFLNMLYRTGNVFIYKRYGKLTKKQQKEMSKAITLEDRPIETKNIKPFVRNIPLRYSFLNPLNIEIEGDYAGLFLDTGKYKMRISSSLKQSFKKNKTLFDSLPAGLKKAINEGHKEIDIDPSKLSVFYYKKDDWSMWAYPMINPIIDDIIMLEKMKLADMSALDGAISNIRLWTLGSLEHKILPNRSAIDKLRNILASNVGGGTMDLVWGPEIDFKESNTQIYKFLGDQKYIPVLNSIYAGIGIPPTLTGLAGQSGGFTNNFISLKTLIERLEYGRDLLTQFWTEEIAYIQKAMGFSKPATLHYDHMILADESAEKNLLIQLADRDIISTETLRDRFGEDNSVEESRIQSEYKKREKKKLPPKADPYHRDSEPEYIKTALGKGELSIQDVTDIKPSHPEALDPQPQTPNQPNNKNSGDKGGRPDFSKDTQPRKKRAEKPKSKPSEASALLIWTSEAQKTISKFLNPALLNHYAKSNMRELSKEEALELEEIKFKVLCKLTPFNEVTPEKLVNILDSNISLSKEITERKIEFYQSFVRKNERTPTIDELRQIYGTTYSFSFFE